MLRGDFPLDLKSFLALTTAGEDSYFIELKKLIKATSVFVKSHHLKSYGLVKNKLTQALE